MPVFFRLFEKLHRRNDKSLSMLSMRGYNTCVKPIQTERRPVMEKEEVKTAQQAMDEEKSRPSGPDLPEDFYYSLLDLPACKAYGYCDDCGRCER